MNKKSGISSAHIDYIDNRTAALLIKTPKYTRITIYLIMALMLILVIWASFAKIDKTTSGTGQVIPSTQRQIVQNLEGGIIKQMYVHEGEKVKKSQKLVLIDDTRFLSDFRGRQQQVLSLKADILRLESLLTTITINQDDIGEHWQQSVIVSEKPLNFDDNQWLQDTDLITRQQAQYHDALANIENQLSLVAKQVKQKNQQLAEAKERLKTLASNLHLSKKQYQMSKPLAKQGIVSEVELIKLQRQINDNQKDYTTTELQLPQLKESIQENILKRIDIALKFRDSVQEKLNTNNDKLADLSEQQVSIKDKVNRTMVTSPVNGIVQKIYVSTIGGVIQPGMPLIEIVPSGDSLEIEVKISPSNIAFLRPGSMRWSN
ncbi:HlyD family type I secretion periplasmic adaptor subunit [Shewanella marina]|uniref:HlyD family type I secretion periplasmic adaptor subunit n=1 Tax=Shewanella marina TaxID=487319 RepID=UPI000AB51975|nr:HlyD family type I secretion periplasmic adaptor subunit [Shewanella marina]